LLSFTIAPVPPGILLLFLFGAVLLVIGMMFFTLGAELAMTPMGEKALYFSFVTLDTWNHLKKILYNKMRIDIPGRGIAFTIPLSSIGGKKVLQYLTVGQDVVIEEESTLKNTEYELLVTIANAGYIDTIMDAARNAHAPGGTVVHAKGTWTISYKNIKRTGIMLPALILYHMNIFISSIFIFL
jgi:hypothetical protein